MSRLSGAILRERWAIRRFIGQGAMARVYEAQDLTTGEEVAVKILGADNARDPVRHDRFRCEVQAAAKVRHPNVVRLIDMGQRADGSLFLVMELLSGETLADYLARQERVPADLALTIARHTAAGLSAIHRAGVVHRDVKPGNLFLVGPVGDPYGVKLIDFGMATLRSRVSGWGMIVGSPAYMAPEQASCDRVDARADVYALGVVLFRMLTGHLPFDAGVELQTLAHALLSPVPPPSWLDDGIDPRVETVVVAATRKNVENRYASMDMMLRDLDSAVGIEPGDPLGVPLVRDPDAYEPRTDAARDASRALAAVLAAPAG